MSNPTRPTGEIDFDINGLYILLSDIGAEWQFHWGFYLATKPGEGRVYHLVNNIETNHKWEYRTRLSRGVPHSISLLVALKIAVMDPALHGALGDRLKAVSQTPPVTCRIWLKRALQDLDDEGYIKLKGGVDDIELEGESAAVENKHAKIRQVIASRLSAA
ncbi:uncharacterized protein DSM5745_04427 [Aspergillus mulundensis]|uniref:Uncharacterized protein n=1 Tax=Aspergillus mulundensis TaxID=1810919 RepID=A0A3D8SD60_9EURO|nr:Uncharacterized protein DSM5745_04427 [Aspergillus mulundensis]RDW84101.1 Uncharacterized protein DSM5745_04427 [Aspergillus mulundensis]